MDEQKRNFLHRVKAFNFEVASFRVLFFVIFLLPLFALPFGVFAVDFSKAMFAYIGVSVSALLFFIWGILKNSITIPKSSILAGLFLILFTFGVSAFLSSNVSLSFFGAGYEVGTFASIFFLAVVSFLIPTLFRKAEHLEQMYKAFFISAFILFVAQFLHTGFGFAVPPWEMFQDRLSGVLGSWNDLGIFFGLITILSLFSIEFGGNGRRERFFLWVALATSLVAVFFVNFSTLQYTLCFFVLAILAYRFANPPNFEGLLRKDTAFFLNPTFFVFIILVAFISAHQWIGGLVNFLGIQFTQISPSWEATLEVVKGSLSSDFFFGSGPNTFLYDWLVFKPESISGTVFWDTRFHSGVGRLPSMVAEIGFLGASALIIFFSSLLYSVKTVVAHKEHSLERMLLVSSFFGSVYLWIFTVIYSPGFLIFAFAGIFTGVFIASLGLVKSNSFIDVALDKNTKRGLLLYFITIFVALVFVGSIFVFSSKYLAGYFYTAGVKEVTHYNNADKANMYLQRAVAFDPQDVYFRSSAEVGLLRLKQMIDQSMESESVSDAEKTQFGGILTATVQSAKNATIVNPIDPENWMELGRVYETMLQIDPNGFKDSAIFAYKEALRASPKDPTPLLSLARMELQAGNTSEALKYLNDSLKIKNDFTAGHIMIAEVAVSEGELKEAISKLEQAVIKSPNNPENVYIILRIGVLYFQDGYHEKARTIFENLVSANPNYIDARYSLGLVYYKNGMKNEAIEQFEAIKKLAPENKEVQIILDNLRSGRDALGSSIPQPPEPEPPAKKSLKKK